MSGGQDRESLTAPGRDESAAQECHNEDKPRLSHLLLAAATMAGVTAAARLDQAWRM